VFQRRLLAALEDGEFVIRDSGSVVADGENGRSVRPDTVKSDSNAGSAASL